VIVAMADTEMAGVLYRYDLDFSYLLLIPTVLVVLSFCNGSESKRRMFVFALLCLAGLVFDFATLFVHELRTHYAYNPDLFYAISSALEFWL
jgi:hypothetical protein